MAGVDSAAFRLGFSFFRFRLWSTGDECANTLHSQLPLLARARSSRVRNGFSHLGRCTSSHLAGAVASALSGYGRQAQCHIVD